MQGISREASFAAGMMVIDDEPSPPARAHLLLASADANDDARRR